MTKNGNFKSGGRGGCDSVSVTAPITIAEFAKNKRESVRVAIDEYKGQMLISVRVFFRAGDDDDWRPGRSGISMAIAHLPNLAAALAAAETKARSLRLIAPLEDTSGG